MPEVNGGGLDFNSEMAELSLSMAKAGEGTGASVRLCIVPTGSGGSAWQPFMESKHD